MSDISTGKWTPNSSEKQQIEPSTRIRVIAFGTSLSLFLIISYILCVVFDLLFPAYAMHLAWAPLLPGFVWLTWTGFLIGLIGVLAYAWYIALIFGPLYNFFATRRQAPRNVGGPA